MDFWPACFEEGTECQWDDETNSCPCEDPVGQHGRAFAPHKRRTEDVPTGDLL